MSFETFLTNLASVLEFKDLKPDRHGTCLITIKKEQILLLFEYDTKIVPNTILVSSPIGILNEENKAVIHQAMIKNQEIEETLSIRTTEHQLYLHRRFSSHISVADLKILIDSFLDQIKQAKELLKHPPQLVKEASQPLLNQHLKA